jgi:hypothetical protein
MAREPRTVVVTLDGEWEGASATLRADGISARVFIDLSSNSIERQMSAVSRLVVSHNFKGEDGAPLDDVLEAPMDLLAVLISKWGEAVSALPPR